MTDYDAIPSTLRELDQWICWREEMRDDKPTKLPVDPHTGDMASTTDADTWADFETAKGFHERDDTDTAGLGFVFDPDGTIAGVDLDDMRNPENGRPSDKAKGIIGRLDSYTEVSPSGTGYHVYVRGIVPPGGNRSGDVEIYDEERFFTVTGDRVDGTPETVEKRQGDLADVHAEYIADGGGEAGSPDAKGGGDADNSRSTDPDSGVSDAELIEKAKNAENGDKFQRLWDGDTSGYESHSEAQQALANLLAFWTRGDRQRMQQLFERSNMPRGDDDLRKFEKYDMATALEGRTEFYDPDTATDGGAAAQQAGVTDGPTLPDKHSDELTPIGVIEAAGYDPDDTTLADLRNDEIAYTVASLIQRSDEKHFRWLRDNSSLYACTDGLWSPDGEERLREVLHRALRQRNGKTVASETEHNIRSRPSLAIERDALGLEPGQVAVENGLLDLDAAAAGDTGDALRELHPEDYALTRLPVEYDPTAEYGEWDQLVEEWAEEGKADALQEYVGYCLHVGDMPIHRALLLVGSGANGKGTFLSVVRALLGERNTTSIELQTLANEKDAVAEFYGSVANIDDDLSARKLGQGLGMFKKLVGGDHVRGRHLYEDGFEFQATGKHLYAANEVPQVDVPNDDEAFWRRWLLVEFPNHYPKGDRDETLRDRLTTDEALSGVLNWAIEGWSRLMDQGHFTGEEKYAQAKRERWQSWGESADKFIADHVERDEDAERLTTQQAHRRYTAWCRENGEDPIGDRKFTMKLKDEDVGYKKSIRIDGRVTRGYDALGLSDDVPELEDTPERETDPDGATQQRF